MARIQTLSIPAAADQYPYALVVDECTEDELAAFDSLNRDELGARFVIITAATLDVP